MKKGKIEENPHVYSQFIEEVDTDFLDIFGYILELKNDYSNDQCVDALFRYLRFFRGLFDIFGWQKLSITSGVYEEKIAKIREGRENLNQEEYFMIDEGIEKIYSSILRMRMKRI